MCQAMQACYDAGDLVSKKEGGNTCWGIPSPRRTMCALLLFCNCYVITFIRSFALALVKSELLPFDLDNLPRIKNITKGQRVTISVKCEALTECGPAELQSIRDGFAKVFEGVRSDMDFDDLPKEVTDRPTA